ncbi:helix-turn-helix domain-containing protein [Falcatimonas sp. MSJ-15]|uniref:helix-turn-helix domain-containing protein n=1 Tax=Falcatimonas sp. MSJ-15 TaxID=2841515 RepID=UPI001C0FF4E3|nr:helix-turn-helix transcriptional regulator [Falcatimonas sp. MSJ-15]MBU5469164.1 helix-turn-helix domain-containing protein [Falcatimonas sp. MSJ-15]
MPDIGKRIRLKREELNMTQEELASRLGYKSKTTIAKIENGTNDIVQSKVAAFADVLNTTPAYLMGWTEEPNMQEVTFSSRDKQDIAKRLEATLNDLESNEALMFSGQPLDDATKELLRLSLENSLRIAKVNAKEKYTPKKYKNDK